MIKVESIESIKVTEFYLDIGYLIILITNEYKCDRAVMSPGSILCQTFQLDPLHLFWFFAVIKTTILLKNLDDFGKINEVYKECKYLTCTPILR